MKDLDPMNSINSHLKGLDFKTISKLTEKIQAEIVKAYEAGFEEGANAAANDILNQ